MFCSSILPCLRLLAHGTEVSKIKNQLTRIVKYSIDWSIERQLITQLTITEKRKKYLNFLGCKFGVGQEIQPRESSFGE